MSNVTNVGPRTGYDLPVYGLADGLLLHIHIPAMLCIAISLLCAVATVLWSVHGHWSGGHVHFFEWTQGERNIIYLAVCDGCFNLAHLFDHAHYVIVRDHVQPVWLCQLYAFIISEFICAQHLLVNLIALSACVTIHRERMVGWGVHDWRQLLYTFGGSLLIDLGCLLTGAYGPTGSFCYFDPVAGVVPHLVFSVAPLVLLFSMNVLLYGLTFRKIRQEERKTRAVLGTVGSTASAAARTGMLFVAAFFIQWWASVVWGLWQLVEPPPLVLHQFATTFCNLGGVLNFGVFFILRRRRRRRRQLGESVRRRHSGAGDPPTARCRPRWMSIGRRETESAGIDRPVVRGGPAPSHRTARSHGKPADGTGKPPATTPLSAATPASAATPLSATTPLSAATPLSTTTPLFATTSQAATTPLSATTPKTSSTPLCPADLKLITKFPAGARRISSVSPRYSGRRAAPPGSPSFSWEEQSGVNPGGTAAPQDCRVKGSGRRCTPPEVIISSGTGSSEPPGTPGRL